MTTLQKNKSSQRTIMGTAATASTATAAAIDRTVTTAPAVLILHLTHLLLNNFLLDQNFPFVDGLCPLLL